MERVREDRRREGRASGVGGARVGGGVQQASVLIKRVGWGFRRVMLACMLRL